MMFFLWIIAFAIYFIKSFLFPLFLGGSIVVAITLALHEYGYDNVAAVVAFIGFIVVFIIAFNI